MTNTISFASLKFSSRPAYEIGFLDSNLDIFLCKRSAFCQCFQGLDELTYPNEYSSKLALSRGKSKVITLGKRLPKSSW